MIDAPGNIRQHDGTDGAKRHRRLCHREDGRRKQARKGHNRDRAYLPHRAPFKEGNAIGSAYSGFAGARDLQQVPAPRMKLQTFFDGPVWRYAARLAGSAVICGSAYC